MSTHHASHTGAAHYQGHQPTHHSSHSTSSTLRAPTAGYADPYGHYPTYQHYGHPEAPDPRHLPAAVPPVNTTSRLSAPPPRISVGRGVPSRNEMHSFAPYPAPARPIPPPGPAYVEPETPVNESTIKKKRKRADAAQLKVLNDVYQRTAFPSTEERQELAKKLDMSARSVQIWFQNKRQAMRQSNRQANPTTTAHNDLSSHPLPSHGPIDSPVSPAGYVGSPTPPMSSARAVPSSSYISRSPEGVAFHSMGRSPQSTPAPRRVHSPNEHGGDPRKWNRGY
ncbi:homeobox-domain-containing protein [Gloeophyllum trabeum ATCC 11539]|uniref:Homeobox-domain-containing protein n=1 Tax=Gloeophyllum trabeum (strain ATCC 11539 / FP-39264 / Madison 617) TaxID=670483 RepID=S7RW76_GLOTA|nr:homeobox-domain-containing protein [Gloeophyllum trabeum ATCC 11539]EPQ57549.1 homeobox-domain-containing protein [Gloeophyllum trabeum ATCC 11539]